MSASGNRYIIVLTDYLTKWPEAAAIPSTDAEVITGFINSIICCYGSIKTVIIDQGREFCNQVNDELFKRLSINHRVATAYHPQTNGLIERYNQTLINCLVKYINDDQSDWDRHSDPVLMAYRSSVHKSTKQTHFFLAFGKKPRLLIVADFPVGSGEEPDEEKALDLRIKSVSSLLDIHSSAKVCIKEAQSKLKDYFDRTHAPPTYVVGDSVPVNNAQRNARKEEKLTPRWSGPFTIVSISEKGTYRLLGRKALVSGLFLRKYHSPDGRTRLPNRSMMPCAKT